MSAHLPEVRRAKLGGREGLGAGGGAGGVPHGGAPDASGPRPGWESKETPSSPHSEGHSLRLDKKKTPVKTSLDNGMPKAGT